MPAFRESDLLFTFPDDWAVRSFDKTDAFKSLSGHGLKGVDFIAITPDDRLILLEAKNYHPRVRGGKTYSAKRRSPDALAEHVFHKFADSRRLIRIVWESMRRSWWIRLQLRWMRWRGADPRNNYWFWNRCHTLAATPECIVLMLWIETPERQRDYDGAVENMLRERLPPDCQLRVVDILENRQAEFPIRARLID